MIFEGVGVALLTLFDDRGDVNAAGTAELAVRLVELGVRAVVVAGSTGEAATLSPEERDLLLQAVRDEIDGAAPVI
ncbi:MAG: dihydrodipicolinate synthase family protein, partial [Actinomycetota bacterium]